MTGKTGHRQTRAAKQHPIGAPLPDETFRILGFVTMAELDKLMAKRLIVTRTVPERPEADGKKTRPEGSSGVAKSSVATRTSHGRLLGICAR